jgi:hypothetical protein
MKGAWRIKRKKYSPRVENSIIPKNLMSLSQPNSQQEICGILDKVFQKPTIDENMGGA